MNNTCYAILLMVVIAAGCSGNKEKRVSSRIQLHNQPLVMIVKQRSDTSGVETAGQLEQAFTYTKIPFTTVDLDLLSGAFTIPPSTRVLCITSSDMESFTDTQFKKILSFVTQGGTLFLTNPVFEKRFNFLSGIKKDAVKTIARKAYGFIFNEKPFPGFTDHTFRLKHVYAHNGIAKDAFSPKVKVIAASEDSSHTPVIIKNRVGQGQVYMFNAVTGFDKLYRGLLFSMMLPSLENIAYPVVNASTIFLDDFPLPLYQRMEKPIDWEYGMTEGDFIAKVWWPDMQALADSFHIDYTTMLAFNYNANVVPPFDFDEWQASTITEKGEKINGSIWLARQVKNSRHELGFHGYNHISLWLKDWPNQEFMASALQAARKEWRIDDLGSLPVTYVPPTNDIDSVGLAALRKGMPQIKYMSSLYFGSTEDGGNREFGPDPYRPDIYDYPRISSGFIPNQTTDFNFQSLYVLTGIWTHFLHPDDVFQHKENAEEFASRNELGLGWHRSKKYDYGLYEEFKRRLQAVHKIYPLMRYLSVKEAVPKVKKWNNLQIKRGRTGNETYAVKANPKGSTKYWFVYTDSSHVDTLTTYLKKETSEYHFTPVWDGFLVQFKSQQDSLYFPDFEPRSQSNELPDEVQKAYAAYVKVEEAEEAASTAWRDTRLQDARAALQKHPSSRQRQERVIKLAVEFDRVPLAIDILERRLLEDPQWRTDDIERLLTYYGWEDDSHRAFSFLKKMWAKYHDQSVITFKDMLVKQYGAPDESFQTTWLQRDLRLNPDNKMILHKLITTYQSKDNWPQTKAYLQKLIKENPESDSLYAYTLQRSFYYDSPDTTLHLLEHFPDAATAQLKPLASEIANLYAYTAEDYTRALEWADCAPDFPVRTKLEWLLQQKRYKAFMDMSDRALTQQSQNDSLRTFIGQELMYAGFYKQGYKRLYPLFKKNKAPTSAQKLVHSEIGYTSYAEQKQFYKEYPAFFSDSLKHVLQHKYRKEEAPKAGLTVHYATDNFHNTLADAGAFFEWGNRQKYTHRILVEEAYAGSDLDSVRNHSNLPHLAYKYTRIWPDKSAQFSITGGLYDDGGSIKPNAVINFGKAVDSTYTSVQAVLKPVLTAPALQKDINEIDLALYREDAWGRGHVRSALSLTGKRFSNDVYAYEGLGRLYYLLPFSTAYHRFRAIGEGAYSDATTSFTNGVPYYTPDHLLVEGFGADYRYQNLLEAPTFSLELELMAKNDNRDGFYMTSSAHLNARMHRYWELSLDANISSSAVYHYNEIGFTVSYLFPHSLKPGF